jgi:hypothetical protein
MAKSTTFTEFKWVCKECGTTNRLFEWEGDLVKAIQMNCQENSCCAFFEEDCQIIVDDSCREISKEVVDSLPKTFVCQSCDHVNLIDCSSLTTNPDNYYCQACETWQSDIPGMPDRYKGKNFQKRAGVHQTSKWDPENLEKTPQSFEEDKEEFREKYQNPESRIPIFDNPPPKIPWKNIALLALISGALVGCGIIAHDGLRPRVFQSEVTNLSSQTTQRILVYEIVDGSGWLRNAPTSNKDYFLIRTEEKQSGTENVIDVNGFPPDGYKRWTEKELQVVGHETVQVPKTVTDRVADGTKEVCDSRQVDLVIETTCDDVTVYKYVERTEMVEKEEPIKDWVDVPKKELQYTTIPVIETWGWWRYGTWDTYRSLAEYSDNPNIPTIDLSEFSLISNRSQAKEGDLYAESPKSSCSMSFLGLNERPVTKKVPCTDYQNLEVGEEKQITYSKWLGVTNVE